MLTHEDKLTLDKAYALTGKYHAHAHNNNMLTQVKENRSRDKFNPFTREKNDKIQPNTAIPGTSISKGDNMIEGFIVLSDRILSAQEFEEYVEIRSKLGYEKCPPDMHFPQPNGVVKLKFAELGLVETLSDAETVLRLLEAKYPKYNWRIEKKYHPDATEVTWYRKRG